MQPYLRHLHTYVSVSGPHLGYLYSSNSLFNSGMWFLKKLKNTQCIHQLSCTDDPDLQKTFLYKLCKVWKCPTKVGIKYHDEFLMELFILHSFFQKKTLEHFRNVILISSPQVLPSLRILKIIFKNALIWTLKIIFFCLKFSGLFFTDTAPFFRMAMCLTILLELNHARLLHMTLQRRVKCS